MSLQTQWRIASSAMGESIPTGLDYAGVHAWMQITGAHNRPRLLADLQTCETAALAAWANARSKNSRHP